MSDDTRETRRWHRPTTGKNYREFITLKRVLLPASPGLIPIGIEEGCLVTVEMMSDGSEKVIAVKPSKKR